ncbi:MAG: amidohydrolase family protein [Bacillota bacterium]|nr:amidohydrolase family protein [Candidatus Fermentithermobacillaceae bacterium]
MIIDCHAHVVPPEISRDPARFAERDPHFAMLTKTKNAAFLTGAHLLRDMDAGGVQQAVVSGFAFKDTGISRLQNDHSLDLSRSHPDKIAALAVVDPEAPGAVAEVERCLSLGACGVGEVFPAGHGFDLLGKGMKRIAGLCREAGAVVLIHVNELVGHAYPGKGDVGPLDAYRFAVENPGLTTIFAHLGGGLPLYAAMPEVKSLEHVYYDNAAQPFLYKPDVYMAFKALGVLDKIMLGSDYPLVSCKRYIRDIAVSGLSPKEQEMILGENAKGVFGKYFASG